MNTSKIISMFVENYISSFEDTSSKDEILKNIQTKEQKDIFKKFIDENKIKMKKKVKKDKNAPKKSESAYILFCKDYRNFMKEKHPDLNNKEITSALGEKWQHYKDTNSKKIKIYFEKASKLKKEYDEKMIEYKKSNNLIIEERPKKAFYYFRIAKLDEIQKSNPDKSKKDINKIIASEWKELNNEKCETVKKFLTIANERKKEYDQKHETTDEEENKEEAIEEEEAIVDSDE